MFNSDMSDTGLFSKATKPAQQVKTRPSGQFCILTLSPENKTHSWKKCEKCESDCVSFTIVPRIISRRIFPQMSSYLGCYGEGARHAMVRSCGLPPTQNTAGSRNPRFDHRS